MAEETRIVFDLQKANLIAQDLSGCLEAEEIASRLTDGLIAKFDCAFARVWLVEPEQTHLRLVASSGMYTNLKGSFARVPMGCYKVGKIAQNRVAFLSNNLPAEPWVKDRDWAIANNLHGFAGYPLMVKDRVIGVLATFSHNPMAPEFLEVLQTLCMIATVALESAINHQKQQQNWQTSPDNLSFNHLSLSDQLVYILKSIRLTLVGTEKPLSLPIVQLFLQAAESLHSFGAIYYRLIYTEDAVTLEAILPTFSQAGSTNLVESSLGEIVFAASCLGGVVLSQNTANQQATQVVLKIPYNQPKSSLKLRINCYYPVLQLAFTQLAFLAGLTVCQENDYEILLLTDDVTLTPSAKNILWIEQKNQPLPKGVQAKISLLVNHQQLRQAVEAVSAGKTWGIEVFKETLPNLSERELEILGLMTQGLRDRDLAQQLIISESTVKFHINNILKKLNAKTRSQALHQAMVNGWLK